MNRRTLGLLLLGFCFAASATSNAADTADPCRSPEPPASCKRPSPWLHPTHVRLELSDREGGPHSAWEYDIEDPANLVVTLDDSAHGGPANGRLMLVAGRFLVTRDIPLQKHHERDPLVVATMHFQLLVQLLNAAFPDGPQNIAKEQTIEVANDKSPITVGNYQASHAFAPPWKLDAKVAPADKIGIDYQLAFSFHGDEAPDQAYVMKLRGQWRKDEKAPAIPDDTPVEGWTMHYVGGDPRAYESGIILEYAEQRRNGELKTVGALRTAARAESARLAKHAADPPSGAAPTPPSGAAPTPPSGAAPTPPAAKP